jgi:hypothetical protein
VASDSEEPSGPPARVVLLTVVAVLVLLAGVAFGLYRLMEMNKGGLGPVYPSGASRLTSGPTKK